MTTAPRIDSIETAVSGLSVSLQSPVVNLTYRTATTTTGTPAAGTFYSSIIGRSRMVDITNDLMPRMGIERIPTQSSWMRVDGEQGSSGQPVYKPANDKFDQVRLVGNWTFTNDASGQYISSGSSVSTDFIEITFYGTGLNILTATDRSAQLSVSLNGGGATTYTPGPSTAILNGRSYNQNTVVNLVSGQALGLYTIKIAGTGAGNAIIMSGFEILNEASTIKVPTGTSSINGKLLTNSSLQSLAYNSGFDSGTLGTRGGRVVIYQKTDGTIGKSVTPTNTSSATLTNTDHSNEEVIRSYNWREFGASRPTTDDFSMGILSAAQRSFTLDDGTTTLVCTNSSSGTTVTSGADILNIGASSRPIILTFIGTGLDILCDTASGTNFVASVVIDGTSIGNAASVTGLNMVKIISGLPYGTHTAKFDFSSGTNAAGFLRFITYGPKKPTLPTGAVELGDYYLMADYVANTSSALEAVATGTIRKHNIREFTYSGTWAAGITAGDIGGWQMSTASASTDYAEYTFFGTGFELRFSGTSGGATTETLSLDGAGNTNFSSYTTGFYGTGVGFTASTGVISIAISGSGGVRVSGIPLGVHKVRVTKTSGAFNFYMQGLDIITPIHTPKNNGPFMLQNTQMVGSSGINDGRTLPSTITVSKAIAQAMGVTPSPNTASNTDTPLADMQCTIKTSGNPIQISYSVENESGTVGIGAFVTPYVDGVPIPATAMDTKTAAANQRAVIAATVIVPIVAGTHTIQLYWAGNGAGTITSTGQRRLLAVREL